ncbi:MAG: zf-HC2 domain-containing protein [Pyrinomonadaceae bacterium]|nr:zf-HC2 domain-containing protein [Pyrinomonadaceae bacterium]
MNCEKCQELLSDFLDGALSHEEQSMLSAHFEECLSCYSTHEELNSIVTFCRENRDDYVAPPNERALWLRIRNTIEAEGARAASAVATASRTAQRPSWLTRWMNRSWELSFSQMATAVAAIAVAVALATAVSLNRMQNNSTSSTVTTAANNTEQRDTTALMNLPVRGLSQEIDYWQQRVDARKVRWNQQRREDFDLNLKVLNEAVQERLKDLKENPHDEMTEEMLNAVLNDKVEFLKEFAEL